LLVKFIDAAQDLSVQIHPPDGPKSPTGVGKTEAWYILHAVEGAEVICGLEPGTTPSSFREAIGASGVESLLHRVPVKRGDVLFIPAGQIHAILGGVLLIEVQQTSDVTYRVWDWNRPDSNGHMRELHIERALDVMDHHLAPGKAVQAVFREHFEGADSAPLGHCPYFDLTAVKITGEHTHKLSGFATTVSVVGGSGKISHPEGKYPDREIQFGDVLLVPGTLDALKFIPGNDGLELLEGFAR
jgi:mannose-6-phosphate isomerase